MVDEPKGRADGTMTLRRGLLAPDRIDAAARRAIAAARERGWVDAQGVPRPAMRGCRLAYDDPEYAGFLAEVLPTAEFAALRRDPALAEAASDAAGRALRPLGADICRITFPGERFGTPAHQDAWYVPNAPLWIAWVPLLDCPQALGPLELAPPTTASLPHDADGLVSAPEAGWRPVPCAVGDVLFFSGLAPHRSLPNQSTNGLRLSVDIRFSVGAE